MRAYCQRVERAVSGLSTQVREVQAYVRKAMAQSGKKGEARVASPFQVTIGKPNDMAAQPVDSEAPVMPGMYAIGIRKDSQNISGLGGS
jgi:hypothetical protein